MAGQRLAGRRIVVTGAASGIGRAIADLFSREGARVALLDIQADALATVAASTGGIALPVDLTDLPAIDSVIASAAAAMGGIDGIVNCAGIAGPTPLDTLEPAEWQRYLAIHLTAPYAIIRAALPHLRAAPSATIVNFASAQALHPAPGACAYAAAKGGLITFSKAIAVELAPAIRVNVIAPGLVNTPMAQHLLGGIDNPDESPAVAAYPLHRVARPEEVAEAALFLTSPACGYVTGIILPVDGGRTLY